MFANLKDEVEFRLLLVAGLVFEAAGWVYDRVYDAADWVSQPR